MNLHNRIAHFFMKAFSFYFTGQLMHVMFIIQQNIFYDIDID